MYRHRMTMILPVDKDYNDATQVLNKTQNMFSVFGYVSIWPPVLSSWCWHSQVWTGRGWHTGSPNRASDPSLESTPWSTWSRQTFLLPFGSKTEKTVNPGIICQHETKVESISNTNGFQANGIVGSRSESESKYNSCPLKVGKIQCKTVGRHWRKWQ